MAWAAVAGTVISAGVGMSQSGKASKDAKKAQQVAMNLAGQSYTPVSVFGPGGAGISFGGQGFSGGYGGTAQPGVQPGGQYLGGGGTYGFNDATVGDGTRGEKVYSGSKGTFYSDGFGGRMTKEGLQVVPGTRGKAIRTNIDQANLSAGDLEPARANIAQALGSMTGNLGMDESTMALLNNYGQASQMFGDAGLAGLDQLQQGGMSAFGQQLGDMAQAGDYSQQLRDQAQSMFGSLAGTAQERSAQALDLMRQQAQPEIDRGWAKHNDNLFATGRLGTSGGALQTEALAKAQMSADRDMQLAAMQEGRNAANAQLQQALGIGGQADSMMGNALNRFTGISQLNNALGQSRFDRTSDIANMNFARAGQLLQNSPQALNNQMLNSQFGTINAGIGAIGGINQNALNLANFAQMIMANQSNARGGQQALFGDAIGTAGADHSANAAMAGQLAQGFFNNGGGQGIIDAFGGLFGGGGNNASIQGGVETLGSGQQIDWNTFG